MEPLLKDPADPCCACDISVALWIKHVRVFSSEKASQLVWGSWDSAEPGNLEAVIAASNSNVL